MSTRSIRKAVITAAGKGTRQYPATQVVQKELIPLVDRDGRTKPTLQIIVEEALSSGIEEIALVVSPEDEATFRAFFSAMEPELRERFSNKPWGLQISDRLADIGERLTTIVQPTQEGYGHAVWCAKEWVGREPFLLLLGDHVYISREERPAMRQVLDVAEHYGETVFAVRRTPEERLHLYGCVAAQPEPDGPGVYRVLAAREKPSPEYARQHLRAPGLAPDEYLCFFGMHALTPAIFDALDEIVRADARERGEIQFTSAQALLIERVPTLACEVNADSLDMGTPLGLIETQIALALNGAHADDVRAFWNAQSGQARHASRAI